MCLVDRDETHFHVSEFEAEELGVDAFGRKVEKFVFAEDDIVELAVDFFARQPRVDGRGTDFSPAEVFHLVFHQRNERCDHQAGALHHKCRHLEGDAFAAAGGHEAEGVVTGEQTVDNFALDAAKIGVAPAGLQHRARIVVIDRRLCGELRGGQCRRVGEKLPLRRDRFAPNVLQGLVGRVGLAGRWGVVVDRLTHRDECLRFATAPRRVCGSFPPPRSRCRRRGAF